MWLAAILLFNSRTAMHIRGLITLTSALVVEIYNDWLNYNNRHRY